MPMVKERLNKLCELLLSYSVRTLTKPDDLEAVESDYKKGHTPPEYGWKKQNLFCGAHKHFWVRGSFRTPAAEDGSTYILRFHTGVDGRDMLNPQGLLYLNGEMIQGIDTNHMEAFLEPDKAYEMYLYLYTASLDTPFILQAELAKLDEETDGLYFDMLTPLEALDILNENTDEYKTILSVLEQAANLVDIRSVYSEKYYASIKKARNFLKKEFYDTLCSTEGKPVVHCIGHTHIDMEWRWERRQTREKVQRSFATASALMKRYPEYLFTLTQPEIYCYLKEEAPEKYKELKKYVFEGRWEPEGAMWVECDCNLVSGESLIRQILHGKNFFKDEFSTDSRVLFLPDVFGYSAAMPQILKKSGIDYFVTSKISWNETNTMPYDSFMWKGIDGTEIFSSFITAHAAKPNHQIQRKTTYSGFINASQVMGAWDRYQQKEFNKNTLITFGYGDGGGGPTRQMLERQRRLKKGIPGLPVTKMNFLLPYVQESERQFAENTRKLRRTPKWVGELYLEYHRGTYTVMAKNKRSNRKSEFLIQKAEALSYTDLFCGGSYDSDGLNSVWRLLLHNQFHDILPGTSIREVYDHTEKDYAEIENYSNNLINDKLKTLSNNIESSGGVLVYNSLGFARDGSISVNGNTVELDETVPAFGWSVIKDPSITNRISAENLTAENQFYRLTLDDSGNIVSLFDKSAHREVIIPGAKANVFTAFEDHPYTRYDAWDIADYYRSKQYTLDGKAQIKIICDGTRKGFFVTKTYMESTINQKIWLYSKSRRIDFETEIDWHQQHQILKVAFPLDIHADSAAYEIQYGHVKRPTHSNTSWDSAKFEVCAHKWADISEHGYGVALLNDCKYGFSADGSTLELTVLKRPTYPNPDADEGKHIFTYSLIPHSGDFRDAGIIREAYMLNQPLDAAEITGHSGNLPEQFSLVSCDAENVIIETVKKTENSDDMIVRLYEAFDSRGTVTVKVAEGFKDAYICDMNENESEQLSFNGKSVCIPIRNFEIITLKFKK